MTKAPPHGHLMPESEAALAEIVADMRDILSTARAEDVRPLADTIRALIAQFGPLHAGQYFEGRFGRDQHGRITSKTVALRPPQLYPVRPR